MSHVLLVVFRSHQRHSYCQKHGLLRGIRFGTQPGSDPLLACDPSRFHVSKQQERMWSPAPAQLRADAREYANASPHSHRACRRALVAHPCRRRLISSKFSTGFGVVMVDRGHVSRGKRTCRPYRNCAALMVVRGPRHSTKLAAAPSPLHPRRCKTCHCLLRNQKRPPRLDHSCWGGGGGRANHWLFCFDMPC